jgi:hypothetical protein
MLSGREKAFGNRGYFLNRPHNTGSSRRKTGYSFRWIGHGPRIGRRSVAQQYSRRGRCWKPRLKAVFRIHLLVNGCGLWGKRV